MAAITFPDFVDDRADVLADRGLDGMKLALVSLPAGNSPDHADIDRFFNGLHLAAILADIAGIRARQVFRVRGGSRIVAIVRAGRSGSLPAGSTRRVCRCASSGGRLFDLHARADLNMTSRSFLALG
jgi:hypothetical protein